MSQEAINITVSVDRECHHVLLSFGPMDAGDVAHLVEHIHEHHHEFREMLVDHVTDALMAARGD